MIGKIVVGRRLWLGATLLVTLIAVVALGWIVRHHPVSVGKWATSALATRVQNSTRCSLPSDNVSEIVGRMSQADLAGQVLMIGTNVDAPDGLGDTVTRYHLGGVFLNGRSTTASSTLRAGIDALQQRAQVPLLVSLDQEGGQVQTLQGADFPKLPSALELGSKPTAEIEATAHDSARRLAHAGITLDLAPVADTVPADLGRGNPPIGALDRQFSSDPAKAATAVRTVVNASQKEGVLTVLKHFPGLGRVRKNTDTSTEAVDASTSSTDPFLQPFKAGIQAASAGVMISSATYPLLDPDNVAAFSPKIITGLLRSRLGFKGLVLSDDLGVAVAVTATPPGQRAIRFITAGGDLVLTLKASDVKPMAEALLDQAQHNPTFAKQLTAAATHILQAKKQAGILHC